MTDTEPGTDETLQEIEKLLAEITAEASSETENPPPTDSQTGVSGDTPANSTAERILDVLRADARVTIREIAERVDVSEPTVRKYIDQLEAKDVILGYSVEVDPGKLGHQTISVVRMEIDGETLAEATEALAAMEAVRSLFTLRETTGAIAEIRADGFGELSEIISDEILAIDGVEAAHTTILEERRQ